MFDARLRPLIDPALNRVGAALASAGVSANMLTIAGMIIGLGGAVLIGLGEPGWGLSCIGINRLLDGLDGAVARTAGTTDLGGYLDIVADFAFYVSVPIGFGFLAPDNLPYALLLVASFVLTGVSFLAFAVIAAKRGERSAAHGEKSFFYSTGLAEGTETIAFFVAMCLIPSAFPMLAAIFTGLCVLTVFQRSMLALRQFG